MAPPGLASRGEMVGRGSVAAVERPDPAAIPAATATNLWTEAALAGSTTVVPPWPSLLVVKVEAR
jgi:hypothetical protein